MNPYVEAALWFALLIPSITFHEFMHGWVAYLLGDPTAKNAGRLTMNPLKSIDPFGSILLPLVMLSPVLLGGAPGPIFGYAKPVPYNPMYFKNLRQGEIMVGFAGPAANLLLAVVGAGMAWAALGLAALGYVPLAQALYFVGLSLAEVNLVLMFFNLIPIPPLDGSSIVPLFLNNQQLRTWYGIQRYAFGILIVLVFGIPYLAGLVGHPEFSPISWYLEHTAFAVLNLIMPK